MAAMLIHGINPGPLIMVENPTFVYQVVAMMFLASIGILIYGLTLTRPLIWILQFPKLLIMPVVFVLCVVGSYALAQRMFDVYVMLAFGVIGFMLRRLNFPMAPLVLGIVLGDLLEKNLRRGLVLQDGDLTLFFTRPISFVMFLLVAATILSNVPFVYNGVARLWSGVTGGLRRSG
jgi:putative tricarboxylic transport membrane protein